MTTEINNKALEYGIENNFLKLVEWVFEKDEKPIDIDKYLMMAMEKKVDKEIIEILMKNVKPKGKYPIPLVINRDKVYPMDDYGTITGNSTLMCEINENLDNVLEDLKAGKYSKEELNHRNDYGMTVLYFLSRTAKDVEKNDAIIEWLLNNPEVDVNVMANSSEYTPLIGAAYTSLRHNSEKRMAMFLKHPKIDVNKKCKGFGNTALHWAIYGLNRTSSEMAIKILLQDDRINTNIENNSGQTPLRMILDNINLNIEDILKMLIIKEIGEINKINEIKFKDGKTVLDKLLVNLQYEKFTVALIKEHNIKIDKEKVKVLDPTSIGLMMKFCINNELQDYLIIR